MENHTGTILEKQKSSLQSQLFYLIKDSAEKCITHLSFKERDDLPQAITNFQQYMI